MLLWFAVDDSFGRCLGFWIIANRITYRNCFLKFDLTWSGLTLDSLTQMSRFTGSAQPDLCTSRLTLCGCTKVFRLYFRFLLHLWLQGLLLLSMVVAEANVDA